MKTLLLFIVIVFAGCLKQQQEKQAIYINTSSGNLRFSSATMNVEPFCNWYLYTIDAGEMGNQLLISIPSDTLTEGTFEGGLSYWGPFNFTSNIVLNVTHYKPGKFDANFTGTKCHGVINIDNILVDN